MKSKSKKGLVAVGLLSIGGLLLAQGAQEANAMRGGMNAVKVAGNAMNAMKNAPKLSTTATRAATSVKPGVKPGVQVGANATQTKAPAVKPGQVATKGEGKFTTGRELKAKFYGSDKGVVKQDTGIKQRTSVQGVFENKNQTSANSLGPSGNQMPSFTAPKSGKISVKPGPIVSQVKSQGITGIGTKSNSKSKQTSTAVSEKTHDYDSMLGIWTPKETPSKPSKSPTSSISSSSSKGSSTSQKTVLKTKKAKTPKPGQKQDWLD